MERHPVLPKKYAIQLEIARGGMGAVYRALDTMLQRQVAIKVLHAQFNGDPGFVKRFLREARAMARLDHEHIIRVYAVEEYDGQHYIVMEYVPGENLRTVIRRGPCSVSTTGQVALHVGRALAYAHEQGIIHRDIKPANIMFDARGRAKLGDFGIAAAADEASLTATGQIIGTPEYMSPEQARGESLDGRSDLYSLGIVLYEMLAAKTPYAEISKTAMLGKLLYETQELHLVFPPYAPPAMQGIILQLLHKQAVARVPDATTLVSRLEPLVVGLPALGHEQEEGITVIASEGPLATTHESRRAAAYPTRLPNALEETEIVAPPPLARDPTARSFGESKLLEKTDVVAMPSLVRGGESKATKVEIRRPSRWAQLSLGLGTVVGGLTLLIIYLATPRGPSGHVPSSSVPQEPSSIASVQTTQERVESEQEGKGETKAEKPGPAPLPSLSSTAPERLRPARPPKVSDAIHRAPDVAVKKNEPVRRPMTEQVVKTPASQRQDKEPLSPVKDQSREREPSRTAIAHVDMRPLDDATIGHPNDRTASEQRQKKSSEEIREPLNPVRQEPHPVTQESLPPKQNSEVVALVPPVSPVRDDELANGQLQALLSDFRQAYETHDLSALERLSDMSRSRHAFLRMMFSNYPIIKVDIQELAVNERGASARLVITELVDAEGRSIRPDPILRNTKIQIRRDEKAWTKIIW